MLSVPVMWYKNEALEKRNAHFQKRKCFKTVKIYVTRNTILIFPIDCSVRINHEPNGLLNGDIQSWWYSIIDILIDVVTA